MENVMLLNKLGSFILELLQVVIFAVSIFLFIYLLILQPHKIKGASMEPNFFDGEYLLTDKASYRIGQPARGDVVVFKAPPTYNDEFIKRIIGLPGEEVSINDGKILINGRELEEDYLADGSRVMPGRVLQEGQSITVPQDSYFVLGDNRDHSLDSRNIGTVERQYITGRAWFIYWPVSKVGTVSTPLYFF
jgi:signal peptidase I